jgi:hypothetical protein
MNEWVWSIGGMILAGETEVLGEKHYTALVVDEWLNEYVALVEWYWQGKLKCSKKNLSQCHLVQHRSHMDRPGIEHRPLRRESRLCHGTAQHSLFLEMLFILYRLITGEQLDKLLPNFAVGIIAQNGRTRPSFIMAVTCKCLYIENLYTGLQMPLFTSVLWPLLSSALFVLHCLQDSINLAFTNWKSRDTNRANTSELLTPCTHFLPCFI